MKETSQQNQRGKKRSLLKMQRTNQGSEYPNFTRVLLGLFTWLQGHLFPSITSSVFRFICPDMFGQWSWFFWDFVMSCCRDFYIWYVTHYMWGGTSLMCQEVRLLECNVSFMKRLSFFSLCYAVTVWFLLYWSYLHTPSSLTLWYCLYEYST